MTNPKPIAPAANPTQLPAFVSLAEAAAQIGCTRRFLETRIEDGEIKVFRPSARLVRIERGELARWIESYSHGGQQTPPQAGAACAP
jgi:excisionase family DNA binding protein